MTPPSTGNAAPPLPLPDSPEESGSLPPFPQDGGADEEPGLLYHLEGDDALPEEDLADFYRALAWLAEGRIF